jgi:hypothetical protein
MAKEWRRSASVEGAGRGQPENPFPRPREIRAALCLPCRAFSLAPPEVAQTLSVDRSLFILLWPPGAPPHTHTSAHSEERGGAISRRLQTFTCGYEEFSRRRAESYSFLLQFFFLVFRASFAFGSTNWKGEAGLYRFCRANFPSLSTYLRLEITSFLMGFRFSIHYQTVLPLLTFDSIFKMNLTH